MLPFPLLLLNLLHFFNHPAHHILSFSQNKTKKIQQKNKEGTNKEKQNKMPPLKDEFYFMFAKYPWAKDLSSTRFLFDCFLVLFLLPF